MTDAGDPRAVRPLARMGSTLASAWGRVRCACDGRLDRAPPWLPPPVWRGAPWARAFHGWRPPPPVPPARINGVLFIGYVEAALGLGESLRGLIRAIGDRAVPFAIQPFNAGVEGRRIGPFLPDRTDTDGRYDVNVIEIATDQLPHVQLGLETRRLAASYNVLRTYWELPHAPAGWASLLDGIDEIWAPTRFVADALAEVFGGPILIVPPCVDVAPGGVRGADHRHGGRPVPLHLLVRLPVLAHAEEPARRVARFPGGVPGPR